MASHHHLPVSIVTALILTCSDKHIWAHKDIGNLARWSVSSRKFGFGLQHLRDGNEETFWQRVHSSITETTHLLLMFSIDLSQIRRSTAT